MEFYKTREFKIVLNVVWILAQVIAQVGFKPSAESQTVLAGILAGLNVILHAHPDQPFSGITGSNGTHK